MATTTSSPSGPQRRARHPRPGRARSRGVGRPGGSGRRRAGPPGRQPGQAAPADEAGRHRSLAPRGRQRHGAARRHPRDPGLVRRRPHRSAVRADPLHDLRRPLRAGAGHRRGASPTSATGWHDWCPTNVSRTNQLLEALERIEGHLANGSTGSDEGRSRRSHSAAVEPDAAGVRRHPQRVPLSPARLPGGRRPLGSTSFGPCEPAPRDAPRAGSACPPTRLPTSRPPARWRRTRRRRD